MDELDAHGPRLQVAMFDRNDGPAMSEVDTIAARLRLWFAEHES